MAQYSINAVNRKVSYTGSAGVGPYAFAFEILDENDVAVYKNETLLTLTTDYTVTINANGTGSVTLTSAATASDSIVILGARDIERTTDFVTAGDLRASSLNEQLDSAIIFDQQIDERVERSIKAPAYDPTGINMTLPSKSVRADKLLKFDADGNPEAAGANDVFTGLVLGANYVNDTFTGDGTTTGYTLSTAAGSKLNTQVYIDGVYQEKSTYSLTGFTLNFTEAPPVNASIEVISGDAISSFASDASQVNYDQGGTGFASRTVESKLQEFVSVKDFGAVGDGVTDDTAAIQSALNSASNVVFPDGIYITTGNTFYSNQTIIITGTLKLAANQPTGAVVLKNDDPVSGNSHIVITGTGTIDGNRANQTGSTEAVWHTLVYFENCQHVEFSVRSAKGNYYPRTVSTGSTGAIYAKDSSYVIFQNSTLSDWSREGFWIENSDNSKMLNLVAIGGVDSYSGYQFSGDYNEADNLYVENAGASGGSMDSRYSTFSNLVARDCSFFWGWGFGHGGIPASFSTATNVVSINNGLSGTSAARGGIGIVNGTEEFTLTNFYCANNNGRGVSVSANADKIKISNGRSTGNSTFGLVLFGSSSAIEFEASNLDLRGNTSDAFSTTGGSAAIKFSDVRLGSDALEGAVDLAGIAANGTVTVNNNNAVSHSNIIVFAANPAGARALPALNSKANGSFVIGLGDAGVSPAFARYIIK